MQESPPVNETGILRDSPCCAQYALRSEHVQTPKVTAKGISGTDRIGTVVSDYSIDGYVSACRF